MTEKLFFNNSRNQKLCGILEEPDLSKEKVIIIVHGYSSSKEGRSPSAMAGALTKANINSFNIDLDGCGESEGKFEDQTLTSAVRDIEAAIELMKSLGYNKIGLFGSSMAGPPCMTIALKYQNTDDTKNINLYRMALKAPVSDVIEQRKEKNGKDYIEKCRKQGFFYKINGKTGKRLKVNFHFYEDAEDYHMHSKVKSIKVPTLIIHGTADEAVPLKYTKHLVENFPEAHLIIVEGADHQLEVDGSWQESMDEFVRWFKDEKE